MAYLPCAQPLACSCDGKAVQAAKKRWTAAMGGGDDDDPDDAMPRDSVVGKGGGHIDR